MDKEEIWKDIAGYEGYYQVSTFGRIRGLDRVVKYTLSNGDVITTIRRGKIRHKSKPTKDGYFIIGLHKDGKTKHFSIHRLVALAFVKNPMNLPEVNHMDCVKTNNYSDNLEWVDEKGNQQHAKINGRIRSTKGKDHYRSKPIALIDSCGNVVSTFISGVAAADSLGLHASNIYDVCKGKVKTTGGYMFKYI